MGMAISCLVLLLAAAAPSAAEEPSATVVACTRIENNSCEGAAVQFPASVGKLWGFSQVVNVPDRLIHVWFYRDRELGRIAMPAARASRWRCWSNVTVSKDMVGPWRLEARDPSGKVLASFAFTVQ